jgi:hypothetical protein
VAAAVVLPDLVRRLRAARSLIEQPEPPSDRRRLLERERPRLDEARALLTSP